MKTTEMRKFLKDKGIKVPQKNTHLIELYEEVTFDPKKAKPEDTKLENTTSKELILEDAVLEKTNVVELVSDNVYTYVGAGASSPQLINFMGKQKFMRGEATEVNDLEIRRKIETCPTFVKGSVDKDFLFKIDEGEQKKEAEQLAIDKITNDKTLRIYSK